MGDRAVGSGAGGKGQVGRFAGAGQQCPVYTTHAILHLCRRSFGISSALARGATLCRPHHAAARSASERGGAAVTWGAGLWLCALRSSIAPVQALGDRLRGA